MSDWELIEYDPVVNRAVFGRRAVQNGETGTEFKVEYYADKALEANKTEYNSASDKWAGDYHKIASLSPGVAYGEGYIAQALKEGDDKSISKWLNDSDNRSWRTKGGSV